MGQIHSRVSEIFQYCYYCIHSKRCSCPNRRSLPFIIKLLAHKNRWNWWSSYQKCMDLRSDSELIIMHQLYVLLTLNAALLLEWTQCSKRLIVWSGLPCRKHFQPYLGELRMLKFHSMIDWQQKLFPYRLWHLQHVSTSINSAWS